METPEDPEVIMKRVFWAPDRDAALFEARMEMLKHMHFDYIGYHCKVIRIIELPKDEDEWE